jgi:hypothetical protein
MNTISWKQFKERVDKLLPKERRFSCSGPNGLSRPLFRGHASNKWSLESTLVRRGYASMPLFRYMQDCESARRLTGNYSSISMPFDVNASSNYRDLKTNFPNFEYLAFLRHHGFPSPLLDWTESPYVAAFFAFRNPPPEGASAARVYVYYSDTGSWRTCCSSDPNILVLGPFATVHERHAIQQCWYTVSVKEQESDCVFDSHESALAHSKNAGGHQDRVEVFDIQLSDREEALADLLFMNISAFTLFRTLDTLFETASHRIFKHEKA